MKPLDRRVETLVWVYLLYAVATMVHNLYLRFISGVIVCTNLGCLENLAETAVWSLFWPVYWPLYLRWI